jgi:hypothetical protein
MKVINTYTLKWIAGRARRAGANRILPKATEALLDPLGNHVLSQPILHTNHKGLDTVRCCLCLIKLVNRDPKDPVTGALDILPQDYNKLPDHSEPVVNGNS